MLCINFQCTQFKASFSSIYCSFFLFLETAFLVHFPPPLITAQPFWATGLWFCLRILKSWLDNFKHWLWSPQKDYVILLLWFSEFIYLFIKVVQNHVNIFQTLEINYFGSKIQTQDKRKWIRILLSNSPITHVVHISTTCAFLCDISHVRLDHSTVPLRVRVLKL